MGPGTLLAHVGVQGGWSQAVEPAAVGLVGASLALGWLARRHGRGHSEGGPRWLALCPALAVAGMGFQVFHFAEHLLQLGYWMTHPGDGLRR